MVLLAGSRCPSCSRTLLCSTSGRRGTGARPKIEQLCPAAPARAGPTPAPAAATTRRWRSGHDHAGPPAVATTPSSPDSKAPRTAHDPAATLAHHPRQLGHIWSGRRRMHHPLPRSAAPARCARSARRSAQATPICPAAPARREAGDRWCGTRSRRRSGRTRRPAHGARFTRVIFPGSTAAPPPGASRGGCGGQSAAASPTATSKRLRTASGVSIQRSAWVTVPGATAAPRGRGDGAALPRTAAARARHPARAPCAPKLQRQRAARPMTPPPTITTSSVASMAAVYAPDAPPRIAGCVPGEPAPPLTARKRARQPPAAGRDLQREHAQRQGYRRGPRRPHMASCSRRTPANRPATAPGSWSAPCARPAPPQ